MTLPTAVAYSNYSFVASPSRRRRGGLLQSNQCRCFNKLSHGKEVKVMLKIYIRYIRYALTVLATVGFGTDVN